MEQLKLVTDKSEIEKLIDGFFGISSNRQLIEELTNLSNKSGCRKEYQSLEFKHELDEYDLNNLQQPMTDNQILISATYHDCEAYVEFGEFYEYLEKTVYHILKRGYRTSEGYKPFDEPEVLQLLKRCKIALGLLSQQEYENEYK